MKIKTITLYATLVIRIRYIELSQTIRDINNAGNVYATQHIPSISLILNIN